MSLRSSASRDSTGKSSINTERTTFHIPQDTVKNLHVTSDTTVKEVVEALLKKYAVTDHPKKFALFEKTLHISDGEVSSKDISVDCPFCLQYCFAEIVLTFIFLGHRNVNYSEKDKRKVYLNGMKSSFEVFWSSKRISSLLLAKAVHSLV